MNVLAAMGSSLYSTLTGGTALTALLASGTSVYNTIAPDGAALPYVVFSIQAGGPDNITPSDSHNMLYWVRAYASTHSAVVELDNQVSALLHRKTLTVTGYTNFWTARESTITLVNALPNGEKTFAAGGFYRIRIDN